MKKLLYLFLAIALFTSCSQDNTPADPIVGVWKIDRTIVDGQLFKDFNELPCTKFSTWEFLPNSDYKTESYSGLSDNECIMFSDQSTWSKQNNQYILNGVVKEIVFLDENTMLWIFEPDPEKDTYIQFARSD